MWAETMQNRLRNAKRVLKGAGPPTAREFLNNANRCNGAFAGRNDAKLSKSAKRVLKDVRPSTARELLNGANRGRGAFAG